MGEQAALIKQIFTVLTLRFIRIPYIIWTYLDNVLFNSVRRIRYLNWRNAMLAVKSAHQSCVVLQKEVITHSLIIW